MRVALISDQHANDVAFRVALEDVERVGVEEVVCLGDVAQGGSQPAETLDRLATLGCETVLGNADALLLEVPGPRCGAVGRWAHAPAVDAPGRRRALPQPRQRRDLV